MADNNAETRQDLGNYIDQVEKPTSNRLFVLFFLGGFFFLILLYLASVDVFSQPNEKLPIVLTT